MAGIARPAGGPVRHGWGADWEAWRNERFADPGARPAPNHERVSTLMKKSMIAGLGIAAGFIGAAALLPAAQGATNVLSAYRELDLFGDAFERVRANYVREVDDSELINAAINGMVSSLDPHSSYMDPKEFADMQVQTRGEFGGLGPGGDAGRWSGEGCHRDRRHACERMPASRPATSFPPSTAPASRACR